MSPGAQTPLRILVLAPTGRDASILVRTLRAAGMVAEECGSVSDLCERIGEGAGAAVVASETLTEFSRRELEDVMAAQPEWSDFPLIVMSAHRRREPEPGWISAFEATGSYVVVLDRPVYSETLVSVARAALRSRARQYQVRDELVERRRAEEMLRDSDRRKNEFLAVLAHELRNPLAAIRNAAEIVKRRGPAEGRVQRAQGVLERQSEQMSRLVEGLLEISRISRGKIHLEHETVDLRDLVETVLHDRAYQSEARRLELREELADEPLLVSGDRLRLAQVVDNLVGNAFKFTRAPGRITVTLRRDRGRAVLRVRDTGVGVEPQMLDRLFEPFQQGTPGSEQSRGGLGIGLALAREVLKLHEGSIRAHSEGPGSGTEFEVSLPLTAASVEWAPSARARTIAARRILLVEDNPDVGEMLRELLELDDHEVTLVETGAEALDVLHDQGADAVLCDLGLPDMSGYALAHAVRGDASLRSVPLIALTGYGRSEDRQETEDAGFDDHVTKPVDADELREILARLESTRAARAEATDASRASPGPP